MIEISFLTPIMALLLAGLIHFGMTMHAQEVITGATRVGARRGTQSSATSGAMQTAAQNYVQAAGLSLTKLTVTATVGSSTTDSSCTATYQFTSPIQAFVTKMITHPIAGGRGGAGWWTAGPTPPTSLTASTVMRY